jgi:hypothetical protein
MDVRSMSPQDVNWRSDLPAYRVHFWKGSSAYEYELTECHNVREAIAWAEENAGADRSYTLYAVVDRDSTRGLVRLFGVDPTKHTGEHKLEWPGQVYLA